MTECDDMHLNTIPLWNFCRCEKALHDEMIRSKGMQVVEVSESSFFNTYKGYKSVLCVNTISHVSVISHIFSHCQMVSPRSTWLTHLGVVYQFPISVLYSLYLTKYLPYLPTVSTISPLSRLLSPLPHLVILPYTYTYIHAPYICRVSPPAEDKAPLTCSDHQVGFQLLPTSQRLR